MLDSQGAASYADDHPGMDATDMEYGVSPTVQPPEALFGRVYAAYGGIVVVLSLAWGWWIDGVRSDRWNLVGGAIAFLGVMVIIYAP